MAVPLGYLAASAALTLLAGAVYREKQGGTKNPGDFPETQSERGSMLPLIIGRDRIGPSVGVLGDLSRKGDVNLRYRQAGWHKLCVGPGYALHGIYEQGRRIFGERITPATHPSGTEIDLGRRVGRFSIYWGESDQPLCEELSALLGHSSIHPYVMYIWWHDKFLGGAPTWQSIEYEVETAPYQSALGLSGSRIQEKRVLSGDTFPVIRTRHESRFRIVIDGDHVDRFRVGTVFRLEGNQAPDGDYTVDSVEYLSGGDNTRIYTKEQVADSNGMGTIEPYDVTQADGVNGAHAAYQILTSHWPHGLGFSPDLIDVDSLEELGVLLESEGLAQKFTGAGGETGEAMLSMLLQDAGVALPRDRGKLRFLPIREPSGPIAILSDDMIVPPVPEIKQSFIPVGTNTVDRLLFEFADRTRNYKKNPIPIDADGAAERAHSRRQRKVTLHSVTSFPEAVKVGERRSQEDLAGGVNNRFHANHEAQFLLPGQPLVATGFPDTMRVGRVHIPDTLSGKTVIDAVTDRYGVPASTFLNEEGSGFPTPPPPPDEDFAAAILEVPGWQNPGEIYVLPPRIRGNDKIIGADLWVSADGVTYTEVGSTTKIQAGGTLDADFDADDGWYLPEGPTFQALSDDILDVPNLVGDDANWLAGRFVAIINAEILFLRNVTALGGDSWRMDDVLRARAGTARAAHAQDDPIFFFESSEIDKFTDLLFAPGASVWFKLQPFSSSGVAVPLDDIAAIQLDPMLGRGLVPEPPGGLVTQNILGRRNVWEDGTDVELDWAWSDITDPTSGAGFQPAGDVTDFGEPQGFFRLEFWSIALPALVREEESETNSYTYADADRDSDFGSNDFEVRVYHVVGSYESQPVSIIVEDIEGA